MVVTKWKIHIISVATLATRIIKNYEFKKGSKDLPSQQKVRKQEL